MARKYEYEQDGWALAKRGKAAKAVKITATGDGVPLGTQRDLGVPFAPVGAARAAFQAWLVRFKRASSGGNPLISDILAQNLVRLGEEGHTTRTTATSYARLSARLGALGVKDISVEQCQAYAKAQQTDGYALSSIFNDLNLLRSALKAAVKRKWIDTPCHLHCWNISKPPGRQNVMTPEMFWQWYDAATSAHIRLFLMVALLTAARHEAICELKWEHVDFEGARIDFTAAMRPKRGVLDKGYQKSRAVVRLTDTLRAHLMAAKRVAETAYVIEYQGRRITGGNLCGNGCRLARDAAGLPDWVTPHVLRHTASTWAEASGLDAEAIMQMTGHTDRRTLEGVYLHGKKTGAGSTASVEAVERTLGKRLRVVK